MKEKGIWQEVIISYKKISMRVNTKKVAYLDNLLGLLHLSFMAWPTAIPAAICSFVYLFCS